MPKMPKIVESLRSVFSMNDRCLAYGKPEIREIIPDLAFYLLKLTEYLNLSRASWPNGFRHFAILGISASSFIFTLKYILPQKQ
jgi:hypothetical protein